MANDKKKTPAVKKFTPKPPVGAPLGMVQDFDSIPPATGRGRYPWATLVPGERFMLPTGSRSCVSGQAKKHNKTFVVRDNGDGTVWVYCTHSGSETWTETPQ